MDKISIYKLLGMPEQDLSDEKLLEIMSLCIDSNGIKIYPYYESTNSKLVKKYIAVFEDFFIHENEDDSDENVVGEGASIKEAILNGLAIHFTRNDEESLELRKQVMQIILDK